MRTSERPSVTSNSSEVRASAAERIQVLGGLVEHEHGEVGQQGPGHGQSLTLAARQAGPVPADLGVQPCRQVAEPVRQPHPFENVRSCSSVDGAPSDPQVLGDGGVEEIGVLAHQADDGAEVVTRIGVEGIRRA